MQIFVCFVMREASCHNQSDFIEAFNSTSRCLDDLRYIDNPYFKQIISQISHWTPVT